MLAKGLHNITTSEDSIDDSEFIADEAQFLFHTRDVCCRQVGSIQIIHEIHHAAEGQNEEVHLSHQLLLRWRTLFRVEIQPESPHDCGVWLITTRVLET